MEQELRENVENGIKFLDTNYPKWEKRIDLETLDLSRIDTCIVGQLDPDVTEYLDVYFCNHSLGFSLNLNKITGLQNREAAWKLLTNIWKEKIYERIF